MSVKIKGNGKNKALAQGNGGIDGDILGSFMPSLPLIEGESEADYQSFREDCLKAVKPKDAIEVVWVHDFINYTWEAQRLRRMRAAILQNSRIAAVKKILVQYAPKDDSPSSFLDGLMGPTKEEKMADAWGRSDKKAIAHVESVLAKHGLSSDVIMAEAMVENLNTLEKIDNLIATYDYRRDSGMHELDKRRDLLAKRAKDFAYSIATDAVVVEAAE